MPDGLGVWIIGAVLVAFLLVLISRWLHRDSEVKSTRFGFYVERNRYDENVGDVWTVDPLPTSPPSFPPAKKNISEEETQVHWPKQEGETNG